MKGSELGEGAHGKLAGSFALPFLSRQHAQGQCLSYLSLSHRSVGSWENRALEGGVVFPK